MHFHFIIDIGFPPEKIAGVIEAGITHIQLRDKKASTRQIIEAARRLQPIIKSYQIPLIINDRVDIALCVEAEGVHLGQSDMPYLEARKLLGTNKIIGLTIESVAQAKVANHWQVDYIGVGPVFPTQTKLDAIEPIGIFNLKKISQHSKHPVIVVGGVSIINLPLVLDQDINGIAVASAISNAQDECLATAQLKSLLDGEKL